MRIAVIGSGIAGLVCSQKLCRQQHDVVLYERLSSIGIDAHSLDIVNSDESGQVRADIPSRMFNSAQWPELTKLYEEVGVEATEVAASQSFSLFESDTYLSLDGVIRPSRFFGNILDKKASVILREIRRFQNEGTDDLVNNPNIDSLSTLDYLVQKDFSPTFIYEFLFPVLSATVFTCSFTGVADYPVKVTLQILKNLTGRQRLFRARLGTRDVARRLLAPGVDLKLSADVKLIERLGEQVRLEMADGSDDLFDHLVLATQANTALQLMPSVDPREASVLGAFRYETIPIYVHTDPRMMPDNHKKWATFNMLVSKERDAAMCSVWLNRFHAEWDQQAQPLFQTINAFESPSPSSILAHCKLQRPVVNQSSLKAWDGLDKLHQEPNRRIWFCGSYAGRGTPLLESGVTSAIEVANAIGKVCVGMAP